MIQIILFFFIILLPTFAADADALYRQYQERTLAWRSAQQSLHEEIDTSLKGKPDEFIELLEIIQQKRTQLKTYPLFTEELEALLRHLAPPEQLLEQNRTLLLGSFSNQHFRPMTELIERMDGFITRWEAAEGALKFHQMIFSVMRDYQVEWESFSQDISSKLFTSALKPPDLEAMHVKISGTFFKWAVDYRSALDKASAQFGSSGESWMSLMQQSSPQITAYFQDKGKILWDIILFTLVKMSKDISAVPLEYKTLKDEFFNDPSPESDGRDPLIKIIRSLIDEPDASNSDSALTDTRSDSSVLRTESSSPKSRSNSALSMTGTRPASIPSSPLPIGSRSTPAPSSGSGSGSPSLLALAARSAPIERKISPSSPVLISSPAQGTPPLAVHSSPALGSPPARAIASSHSSPVVSSPLRKTSNPSAWLSIKEKNVNLLADELRRAFLPFANLQALIRSFSEPSELLLNIDTICKSLVNLNKYYKAFIIHYKFHLSEASDILHPKARVKKFGQRPILIPQAMATEACVLWRNGLLCFNTPDSTDDLSYSYWGAPTGPAEEGNRRLHKMGSLIFEPMSPLYPCYVGSQWTLSLLETLFGIQSVSPLALLDISNIAFLDPNLETKGKMQYFISSGMHHDILAKYFDDSSVWKPETRNCLVTVHRQKELLTLKQFLMDIYSGQASFSQIDPYTYGMEYLFSLVTRSSRPLESYGLVAETSTISPGSTLKLQRTGPSDLMTPRFENCLSLFPMAEGQVPESVRRAFCSHNMPLLLSFLLREEASFHNFRNDVIKRYLLHTRHSSSDELKVDITQAQMLGLLSAVRPDSLKKIIDNYNEIKKALEENSTVAYLELQDMIQPQEAALAAKEEVEEQFRKESSLSFFFGTLVPLLLEQYKSSPSNPQTPPIYSLEDLVSFEKASRACYEICKKPSSLLTESPSFDQLMKGRLPQVVSFFKEEYAKTVPTVPHNRDFLIFFGRVLPALIKKLRAENISSIRLGEHPAYTWEDLDAFSKSAWELFRKVQSTTGSSFDSLTSTYSREIETFFNKKYEWWLNTICGPRARLILMACEFVRDRNTALDQKKAHPSTEADAEASPQRPTYPPQFRGVIESTRFLGDMIKDLMIHTDLSKVSPHLALQIMDILLTLDPTPEKWHASWSGKLSEFTKGFFGFPPHVQSFLHRLSLKEADEQKAFAEAQTIRLEEYLASSGKSFHASPAVLAGPSSVTSSSLSAPSLSPSIHPQRRPLPQQEEHVCSMLRMLLRTNMRPQTQEENSCIEAVCDLIILPQLYALSPSSAGLASFANGKSGIFLRKQIIGGDHLLVTWSDNWTRAYLSQQTLPLNAREILLSHSIIPLFLHVLYSLQKTCPDVQFHPWFAKKFLGTFSNLQKLLSRHLRPTFSDIMEFLWPEIFYMFQEKLKCTQKDVGEARVRTIHDGIGRYTLEDTALALEWTSSMGKYPHHWRYFTSLPFNFDQTATVALKSFRPSTSNIEIILQTLAYSSNFSINLGSINSAHWQNDEILSKLARHPSERKMQCLQLVCALRMGCPPDKLILKKTSNARSIDVQLSGFDATSTGECELDLLTKVVSLFPDVTHLTLSKNGIRSLAPMIGGLKSLSHLVHLSIQGNPIHNPTPLFFLTQLTGLMIDDTYMPDVYALQLEKLVRPKVTRPSFKLSMYSSGSSHQNTSGKERDGFLKSNGAPTLFTRLKSLVLAPASTPVDEALCILEALGENQWDQMLSCRDCHTEALPQLCEKLFALIRPPYDPRPLALKMLYAMSFGLPVGTNPHTLGFLDTPSNTPTCLKKLEISGQQVPLYFPGMLPQFTNLKDLILVNCMQPTILHSFPRLPQLEILDLSHNAITSLKDLSTSDQVLKFPNLCVFIFSHNALTSGNATSNYNGIIYLLNMEHLGYLDLSHNALTNPPPFQNLIRQLGHFDIRHNKIDAYKRAQNVEKEELKFYYSPQD